MSGEGAKTPQTPADVATAICNTDPSVSILQQGWGICPIPGLAAVKINC